MLRHHPRSKRTCLCITVCEQTSPANQVPDREVRRAHSKLDGHTSCNSGDASRLEPGQTP